MMNKIAALISAVMLAAVVLSSCGESEKLTPPTTTIITFETAENSSGKRFSFTLKELSSKIDDAVEYLNGDSDETPEKIGKWEIISEGLADNNGVKYTSYRNRKKAGTLTAAAEDESGKLMNVGCGCDKERLRDAEGREDYITFTATLAQQAGGFAKGDLAYLKKLIGDLLDSNEDSFYFENLLYSKSEDNSTVVIIIVPSSTGYAATKGIRFY